jgi:hypothetical protein
LQLRLPYDKPELAAALPEVLAANAGSMRVLRCDVTMNMKVAVCEALLHAAPNLVRFQTDVSASPAETCRILRNEPPFGPMSVRDLDVVPVSGILATPALVAR